MPYEIKHRETGEVIRTVDADTLAGADLTVADLIGADLQGAYLSDVNLQGANLREVNLQGANLRGANLQGANLRYANLSGAYLIGANLRGANLRGAELSGADLTVADLHGANLQGATMGDAYMGEAGLEWANINRTNLRGADLSEAVFATNPPVIENIHQKLYAAASQPGALNMDDWHMCGTTHCRAGWIVALAGDEGRRVEKEVDTPNAALAIYHTSDPSYFTKYGLPDFYEPSNDIALADMKRMAEIEAGAAQ